LRLLFAIVAVMTLWLGPRAMALDAATWGEAKARLVQADGRVVDADNGGVSHSEGQGYAMVAAVAMDDRATFDLLWSWTAQHLARSDRRLFSWKYDPAADPPIADPNNATDGDIMIAWALSRAAGQWGVPAYAASAAEIRAAIHDHLVRQVAGRTVLLPGLDGFSDDNGVTLNLSYLVFPALKDFAKADPAGGWDVLIGDGLALLLDARFGRFGLNPDWLRLGADGSLAATATPPPRFGFDAVRIPLYLVWGGEGRAEMLAPFTQFWSGLNAQGKPLPGWVDLRNGQLADYPGPRGYVMVQLLALGTPAIMTADLPASDSYYSTMLSLLAALAAGEQGRYR